MRFGKTIYPRIADAHPTFNNNMKTVNKEDTTSGKKHEKDSKVKVVLDYDKWWCLHKPNFFDNDVFNEIK